MKFIDRIIREEAEKEATLEWEQLNQKQKQYISYLLSTNKKYDNPNNSICLYALGISDDKPIKPVSRNSDGGGLCDIDVDFCPKGRKRVMEYVYEKYGADKCAQIGTYAVFKPRGSLRDFARVLGYPISVGQELASMVPPDVSGKSMKFDGIIDDKKNTTLLESLLGTPYDDVVEMAYKAEGLVSQAGVHAAGVVISNSELAAQVPLFKGKHGEIATQLDMHEVEEIGLVKNDFLGLKNLTVIHDAIKMIKEYHGIDIDINKIDIEDQKVYEGIFQQGKLDGVFQFETSSGFRDLCIKIKPHSIEDLSAITALFRPGPLTAKNDDGQTLVEQYVSGRNGEATKYLFEELRPILNETYGVMVYQEQIMRICTDCAGYTLAEADNMRKIIGKKLPEKMALEKEKLVNGCINENITSKAAEKLFENIEGFAAYSFNKAHSVAYSLISYQTAWLKHYYREEFYCALLNNSFKNQEDLVKYIHAIKEDEIPILPPDVNMSDTGFTISEGTIIFGLAGVKGMGEKACLNLVDKRPQNGFTSIADLVANKINKGSISALAMCGALEEISDVSREQVVANIEEIVTYYQKANKVEERKEKIAAREKQIGLWTKGEGPKPRKLPGINEKHIPVFPNLDSKILTKKDKLHFERKTLGFYLTGHPMDAFPGLSKMADYTVQDIKEAKMENRTKFSLPAVVSSIIEKRTRKGQNMGILLVEDKTGRIETTIFPRQWKKIKDLLTENSVYVLKCSARIEKSDYEDDPPIVSLILDSASKIDDDSDALQMHPVEFSLADGTMIKFAPQEEQNYSKWQQAVAFVNNMKRMG